MNINYLELEKAREELALWLQQCRQKKEALTVKDVSYLSFPRTVKNTKSTVALGLFLSTGSQNRWLIFIFKNPFLSLFCCEPQQMAPTASPQAGGFQKFLTSLQSLKGSELLRCEITTQEREAELFFSDGSSLVLQFFGAQANFAHVKGKQTIALKEHFLRVSERPSFKKSGSEFLDRISQGKKRNESWFEALYELEKTEYEALERKEILSNLQKKTHDKLKEAGKNLKSLALKKEESLKAKEVQKKAEEIKNQLFSLKGKEKEQAVQESEKLFKRAKKLKRTQEEVKQGVHIYETRKKILEKEKELLLEIADLPDHGDFLKRIHEAFLQKSVPEKKLSKKKALPQSLKKFLSKEGMTILIGRNHKENEELVMKVAHGQDLWFHVKGRPGAHGLLLVPKGKTAGLESMLDCAVLVAHYSGIKNQEKTEVDYTFRKNLKRVKNKSSKKNEQFLVQYTHNKTLTVLVDEARIARLLLN